MHNIIKNHKAYGYKTTQAYFKEVDRDPFDSSKIYFIYTGLTSINTSYNKEHVWAKSHGDFGTSMPMGSDMHNLHPCDNSLNSTRGNLDFAEGGEVLSKYNGNNRRNSNVSFEPSDFSKGDTARTIFYMAVRYEGDVSGEKDIEVSSPSSSRYNDFSSSASGVHGKFDDLYKWAISGIDPVDDHEVYRNNIIYEKYQHNRNPFIDHPEFVEMIYDKEYSGAGALLDKNPYKTKTIEEEVDEFKKLIDDIKEVDSSSLEKITKAENYYQNMSSEAKELVKAEYNILMNKKEEYLNKYEQYKIEEVINLINEIGEVSLASKEKIEEAEKAYNNLSSSQKEKVTNYNVLVLARSKYDELYQKWLEDNPSLDINCDFTTSEGASGSYKKATVSCGNYTFDFSACFKSSDDFRFGSKQNTLEEKFSSIVKGYASMEMNFKVRASSISLTSTGCYGDVTSLDLLVSYDNGSTWKLVEKKEDNYNMNVVSTFSISNQEAKYAFVLEGSEARLKISKLTIN